MADSAEPTNIGPRESPVAARLVALLQSVPAIDATHTNREVLVDDMPSLGEAKYTTTAHLHSILRHILESSSPVERGRRADELIDNAKMFAGADSELGARLEAWREPLREGLVGAAPTVGRPGTESATTVNGKTYLLSGWRTSLFSGKVPQGWKAEITRAWLGFSETRNYAAGAPWEAPTSRIFTTSVHWVFRHARLPEHTIESEVRVIPLAQRALTWVALGAATLVLCAFVAVARYFDGYSQVPWAAGAGLATLIGSLPPLRSFRERLNDLWITERVACTGVCVLAMAALWGYVHSGFLAIQAGSDVIVRNGVTWATSEWRIFAEPEVPRTASTVGLPDGARIVSDRELRPSSECPVAEVEASGRETTAPLAIRLFALDTARFGATCAIPAPSRTVQSCTETPVSLHVRVNGVLQTRTIGPGAIAALEPTEHLQAFEDQLGSQLATMQVFTVGPSYDVGGVTSNVALRVGQTLHAVIETFPADLVEIPWPVLGKGCAVPRELDLDIARSKLTATGPLERASSGLRRVEIKIERNIGNIHLRVGPIEQTIESGHDAWMVDVMKEQSLYPATVDGRPAEICMICTAPKDSPKRCSIYANRVRKEYQPAVGDNAFISRCGPGA